ncbi:MAG TPA: N-acetylmuramoyl-L-alanine amidase [Verrucomicrobiae bacterium]|nr:N-acetylmuramoyl-L-alanine amidase [Verrucomicrobiae bacterium]
MRLARVQWLSLILAVGLVLTSTALSQPSTLRAYRFGGAYYVAVNDLATYYGLNPDSRDGGLTRAEYKTSFGQLEVEADHRDILLNGVTHWISTPILAERNRLWIAEIDVLKTVDPVLQPGHLRKPGAVVRTVVIDPGHGGTDHGTHGRASYEKTMTLDVAKRVERDLAGSGLRVILTRTTDETVPLEDRVDFARQKGADLYVSIHFNSGGSAEGIETYCTTPAGQSSTANINGNGSDRDTSGGDRSAVTNNRFDAQNVFLAQCIQRAALRATGAVDRGVRRARFWVLRYASCPAILIEGGFLTNSYEEQRILHADYRDTLARAIADGILTYKKTLGTPEPSR